jgi:hypothetical protein
VKSHTRILSNRLEQQLCTYTAAATAAGVGLLGASIPAEAKIIYKAANIPITVNTGAVYMDVNHDGINDFQFSNAYSGGGGDRPLEGNHASSLLVGPAQPSNRVWGVSSNKHFCAAALPKGKTVGPDAPFEANDDELTMAFAWGNSISHGAGCPWVKVSTDYLGFKFVIAGKVHFGWARIRMGGLENTDYITGYAYETIANKPIKTGATKGPDEQGSTLGALAAGANLGQTR